MFTLRKKAEPSDLEREIDRTLFEMNELETDSEEYEKRLSHLERLNALLPDTRRKPVSSDAIVSSATTIFGILIMTTAEQRTVITTKALSLLKIK